MFNKFNQFIKVKKICKENNVSNFINLIEALDSYRRNKIMQTINILIDSFGYLNTVNSNTCVDKENRPIPWYTYPTIDYLKQIDFSEKIIFEYGCGNSSLFWANCAKKVISVEDKKDWYEKCLNTKKSNQEIILEESSYTYINSINQFSKEFDVIIVDGDNNRFECIKNAVDKLKTGGLIILDNSDRVQEFEEYRLAANYLRNKNFIQVDMNGFGPINEYTWTTSLFFERNFNFKPLNPSIQPKKSIGNLKEI